MKKLAITHDAAKDWKRLDAKQYRQIGKAIMGLLADSRPHDSQVLKGAKSGERRVDVGEYRIIYSDDDNTVFVLLIGKRNGDEVYKKWAIS
ncbi:MAG: type II toxin-antitoxin system RelE/ParE family toxin [Pseudomonadota bacterium]